MISLETMVKKRAGATPAGTRSGFLSDEARSMKLSTRQFSRMIEGNGDMVVRCDCGREFCKGWVIVKKNTL